MNRGDLLGAALVGGGLALLGVALGSAIRLEEPAPVPMFGMDAIARQHFTRPTDRCTAPEPPMVRTERARQVRVLVYRIRIGELTLASPEIPRDLSADIADVLEGNGIPPPSAAADCALPLDWQ